MIILRMECRQCFAYFDQYKAKYATGQSVLKTQSLFLILVQNYHYKLHLGHFVKQIIVFIVIIPTTMAINSVVSLHRHRSSPSTSSLHGEYSHCLYCFTIGCVGSPEMDNDDNHGVRVVSLGAACCVSCV